MCLRANYESHLMKPKITDKFMRYVTRQLNKYRDTRTVVKEIGMT